MLTSGLTNAPLTKSLLIYTVASSVALSLFDIKHLAVINISPHFWPYAQFWRALVWQIAGFTNSTEALFAAMLIYHLRVIERAWGKRKMATFLLTILPYTTILPPLLLTLLRPLTLNTINYLPCGPVPTIFALLAQYYITIPHTYRYRLGTTSAPTIPTVPSTTADSTATAPKPEPPSLSLLLSDKSTTYLVAAQLALSQFPGMLLPAAVGWFVGIAWRAELLPGLACSENGFRVPAWVVGEKERRGNGEERGGYEDLRRRLEGEVAAETAEASGLDGGRDGGQRQRRGEDGFVERLRGAW
ncbi:uncharacterized protein N7515_003439 [Penicillium bovifimosum]|uniref:DSC E3 ubiquitin ligase complex subunit 2 n=1 Tax=Penicillium bovifimosum TaxID=126998 RepID=A0A9W9H6I2_9EURO|nr:uncharacterized protein N7515_003439 [Penicillium bovifimosum]KAJ5138591.1 hypothetical protein N7515_003439 [Penicillium bovifimosum]